MKRIFTTLIILTSMVWAGRPITAEDVVNLRYITQPAIDPSGKYIAYVKVIPRNADEKRGGSYREIWVTAAKGSDQRQYTYSPVNSWSPQWTPDGNLLFYPIARIITLPPKFISCLSEAEKRNC